MEKFRVGIIGATGMVGQRFVLLTANHPWFTPVVLAASAHSAGKTYAQAIEGKWHMAEPIPEQPLRSTRITAGTGTVDVDNSGTAGDTTGTTGSTGGAEDTGIDEGTVSVDDLPDSADSQTGAQDSAAVPQQSAGLTWLWVLLGVIAVAAIIGIVVTRKKKH